MAIDFKGLGPNQNNVSQSRNATESAGRGRQNANVPEEASNRSSEDQVDLSPEVQALQSLEAQIRELPEVDSARVEAIRNAIDNGSFEVNADRLAGKLMSLERLIGG